MGLWKRRHWVSVCIQCSDQGIYIVNCVWTFCQSTESHQNLLRCMMPPSSASTMIGSTPNWFEKLTMSYWMDLCKTTFSMRMWMGNCCNTCLIWYMISTNCLKRCPVVPDVPAGLDLILEKSGHGGPPVISSVTGTSGSRLSNNVSTRFSMLKMFTSPMCIGLKCSSKTEMHSWSVSQLMVRDGCIPSDCRARLAAPMSSKKLRGTKDSRCVRPVTMSVTRCPPVDPIAWAARSSGVVGCCVWSAPGDFPGPCCP